MQLLRLELKGFKSFADYTVIPFTTGMTGIVGPNGSGKSNIADAIRWVLGESNVRQLRGTKGEDFIFSGTEKRRAMMSAEVTLVFDNRDGALGEEFVEVAITRRVYRNGDSDFFINKKAVRLKDIHQLLADTGLGRDSMAIIGQNRVDAILNSKPEERRLFFEDVAGISGFKLNKEEALRRMSATERNMERVLDLKSNLDEQLVALSDKAEATKAYMALEKEKRLYDGALALHQYRTSERLQTRLENEQIQLQQEQADLEEALSSWEVEQEEWEVKRSQQSAIVKQLENGYREAQRQGEKLLGERQVQEEKLRAVIKEWEDKTMRCHEMAHRLEGLAQKEALLTDVLDRDGVDAVFWKEEQEKRAICWRAEEEKLHVLERAFNTLSDNRRGNEEEYRNIIHKLESISVASRFFADQEKEMQQLIRSLEEEQEQAIAQRVLADAKEKRTAEELENIEKELDVSENAWNQSKQEVQACRDRVQLGEEKLRRKVHRRDMLEAMVADHEGYPEAIKMVLQEHTAGWAKEVRGAVGDIVQVEERYRKAIQVALGSAWQQIIMDTASGASEAIQFLKNQGRGRVTFLPIDRVKGKKLSSPVLKYTGVCGLAMDLVSFDKKYTGIMEFLLGRVVVVESMQTALFLQKEFQQTLRMVTLEGDLLSPGGAMTGGVLKGGAGQVLLRKAEIQSLEAEIPNCEAELEKAKKALAEVNDRMKALFQQREMLQAQKMECYQAWKTAEMEAANEREKVHRKQELAKVTHRKLEESQKEEVIRQEEEQRLEASKIVVEKARGSSDEWERLRQELDAQRVVETKAKEASIKADFECTHRLELVEAKRKELLQVTTERQEEIRKKQELEVLIRQLEWEKDSVLPQKLEALIDAIEVQRVLEEASVQERDEALAKEHTIAREERERTQASADYRRRQVKVNQRQIELEGKLTGTRLAAERSLQELTTLGFTLQEAQQLTLSGKVSDWQEKKQSLWEAMEELGTINPNAVEEYDEAVERKVFLEHQLNDLETAKEQLLEVIEEMDEAMSDRFLGVFNIVASQFQDVFASLFGGGTAQLELTDKEHLLASGIEIYIQPPGKKRQPLTLLSGGERALTVIALLFSFLAYRPAPFCVLDEVDAALDEANVERFSKYLKRLDDKTQFIVVTHRKKTMEAMEQLHGITMVERGISKVLSVTFDTIQPEMAN